MTKTENPCRILNKERGIIDSVIFFPVIFVRRLYGLVKFMYCDAWLVKGREKSSGEDMVLVYSGYESQKSYMERIIFGEQREEVYLGKKWPWELKKALSLRKEKTCLSIYEMPTFFSFFASSKKCLCIPDWIVGDMNFSSIDFSRRTIKNDIRSIRKNDFTFEITKDTSLMRDMYDKICAPYALKEYGEETASVSYEKILKGSDCAEGMVIKKRNYPGRIGAAILVYTKNTVSCKCVGANMGCENVLWAGIVKAVYYYAYIYLKEKGYEVMGLGASRAFFNDGVLEYKRKWGLRITRFANRMILLRPNYEKRSVRSFLVHNPCVVVRNGKLVGMVFIDKQGSSPDTDKSMHCEYQLPGINKVAVCDLDSSGYAESDSIKTLKKADGML